ncbi:MAG: hypothetical protein J5842_04860 [Lachnospiraceae bacterium]|nr:hypothetical protein [Lachnospiraceae bacterium]
MNLYKRIVSGTLYIALAVILILWKLNIIALPAAFGDISRTSLFIAFIMLVIIVHSIVEMKFGGIFIPIAVLCIIFDSQLGITAITPWPVLIAAFLLTAAFNRIFGVK